MIADSTLENLCRRVQASVERVVEVKGFSCSVEDGKLTLRGQVATRDDALLCAVVARSVPGGESVVNEITVVG
ncbi:BON domain-containing protein [Rhodopirellula sp. JC639]|uniref:BON domain-containing protein n=1 Tax=Stieleria mannarensis TaxID=2755585 RepID=UPI0015FEE9FE